ncbi:MAG: helix-turn-helix domain-containing protein [Stackebrandtia sp.]
MTDGHALSALGLSAVEEAAYRALLDLPDADVSQLAARLSVPGDAAEQLLAAMTKRGLARMVSDGRYAATAPESSIVHILADRLDALRRGYDAVGELEQVYRDARARYGAVPGTETVAGMEAMRSRLGQLQDLAREQVRIFVRPPLISREAQRPCYAAATARGVRYRTLYEKSMLENFAIMKVVREAVSSGTAVRFAASLPVKLVIIDAQIAFIVEPGNHQVALVTEHPALVATACALFEQVWPMGVPAPGPPGADGEPADGTTTSSGLSDPEDLLLLSLLLAGLTDQAIAARLGVGLRTVQRRVRDLMDAAGVDTRIQLGWQASRKGWVVLAAREASWLTDTRQADRVAVTCNQAGMPDGPVDRRRGACSDGRN